MNISLYLSADMMDKKDRTEFWRSVSETMYDYMKPTGEGDQNYQMTYILPCGQ